MLINLYRTIFALLFLTVSLFPSIRADAQPRQVSPNLSAEDMLEKVNALRESNGLEPYAQHQILTFIAQTHAVYISSIGVLTNFDDTGKRPYQRALDAGYAVAGDLSVGGLLTQVIYSGSGVSEDQVIAAWQANAADSVALLSPDYEDAGVGIAAANGITYFVLVAAKEGEAATAIPSSTAGAAPILTEVPNTPLPSGEVYHDVRKDQALWSIALLYGTTIAELKLLNGLAGDEIFEGQRLVIRRAAAETPAPSAVPVTATLGLVTSTPTVPVTPTITLTPTLLPAAPATMESAGVVVGAITLAALLAAGLFAFFSRRRKL
ncbi:MAG: LysM peptidoglycan-binding domain-containing protein [Chloroflexi bacterium]|nr:LysM peptidoglycan-binding domain-containing protein [Chloroflexota bacterium]